MTPYEEALRRRATTWPEHGHWRDLTTDVLRDLAARHGSDLATALVYDRLVRSPVHGPFIERVASAPADAPAPADTLLAVVPGACYREYPQTGADGRRLHDDARRHRWPVERIPVASFGRLATNAQTICHWLRARRESTVVLTTLSKGSADVRAALASPEGGEAFAGVAVWISLSGIVFGSALAGWFLDRPFWRTVARLLCWRHGYPFATLEELRPHPPGAPGHRFELPAGLVAVHVVGLPLRCHLHSRQARRASRRLAALGPTDGGGILLGDLCRLPGLIYPVWGADHYLNPVWDLRPVVRRVIHAALEVSHTAKAAAERSAVLPASRGDR